MSTLIERAAAGGAGCADEGEGRVNAPGELEFREVDSRRKAAEYAYLGTRIIPEAVRAYGFFPRASYGHLLLRSFLNRRQPERLIEISSESETVGFINISTGADTLHLNWLLIG